MKRTRKGLVYLRLFRPVFHFVLVLVSFYITYRLRLFTDLIPFVQLRIPMINFFELSVFGIFAGLVFVLLGFFSGIYDLFKPIHGYYKKFLKSWFIGIFVLSFIAYFGHGFIFQDGISRFILLFGSLLSIVIITFFDIFYNLLNTYFEKKQPYKILFLYTSKKMYDKVVKNLGFYKIYDITGKNIKSLKDYNDLSSYDIIATIGNLDRNQMQQISDIARLGDIGFYHISESYFLDDLIYSSERLGPILALQHKPSPLDGRNRVFKRLFDIGFAVIFLLLFWWFYILVMLFIFILDGRPIFYTSTRVGKGGKLFKMYKFRSMVKNAESLQKKLNKQNQRKGPLFKIENDPRVLRWGRFLRKSSIDELPQVINILFSQMSFVGPRPHLPQEVKKYQGWQRRLLSIKPGLTGYAQIFGRDKLDFDEEAKLDLYYIQNRSVFLDVYVILTTVKVVFKGK